ncbi:MAG: thiamine phosphate synthase, partial [Novosphingobium sp.]|nr:thiamine phosphate synthase [Novosphingobium sp.]
MARCYSAGMGKRQSESLRLKGQGAPRCLLLTDARNDDGLERAIRRLPRGSALVFRHYHLHGAARRKRFAQLAALARARGIAVIGARVPAQWRCDGVYGAAREVAGRPGARLATAHSLHEIGMAVRAGAHAVLLSPVFPTRSHPGAGALGSLRFLMLARLCPLPVIA